MSAIEGFFIRSAFVADCVGIAVSAKVAVRLACCNIAVASVAPTVGVGICAGRARRYILAALIALGIKRSNVNASLACSYGSVANVAFFIGISVYASELDVADLAEAVLI